jgi:hypothetical protein
MTRSAGCTIAAGGVTTMAEAPTPQPANNRGSFQRLREALHLTKPRAKPRVNPTRSIDHLNAYVKRLAKGEHSSGAIVAESYIAELENADKQQRRWRQVYYNMRGLVITASALITVFTALNLHGGAAFALRVLTLVLSATVTIVTAMLELFQVNHRWRLYRQLRNKLENIAWQTAARGGDKADPMLAELGHDFIKAMSSFERGYISQVAGVGETDVDAGPDTQRRGAREQHHKAD